MRVLLWLWSRRKLSKWIFTGSKEMWFAISSSKYLKSNFHMTFMENLLHSKFYCFYLYSKSDPFIIWHFKTKSLKIEMGGGCCIAQHAHIITQWWGSSQIYVETHKGRKPRFYYLCDAMEISYSLLHLILCRLQPIGGYYLNFLQAATLRKLQLPYDLCRLQPTWGSYLNRIQPYVYQAIAWKETTIS